MGLGSRCLRVFVSIYTPCIHMKARGRVIAVSVSMSVCTASNEKLVGPGIGMLSTF